MITVRLGSQTFSIIGRIIGFQVKGTLLVVIALNRLGGAITIQAEGVLTGISVVALNIFGAFLLGTIRLIDVGTHLGVYVAFIDSTGVVVKAMRILSTTESTSTYLGKYTATERVTGICGAWVVVVAGLVPHDAGLLLSTLPTGTFVQILTICFRRASEPTTTVNCFGLTVTCLVVTVGHGAFICVIGTDAI